MKSKDEGTLEEFAGDIWTSKGKFNLLGAKIGTRMTVVRLSDGRLWMHSPIPYSEELGAQLNGIGELAFIVAPSTMHNLNTGSWKKRYPEASVFCAQGANIKWDFEKTRLAQNDLAPWRDDIKQVLIDGMPRINEWVFIHRQSRTLVVADLLFNIQMPPDSWTRLLARLYGVLGKTGPSTLFRKFVKSQADFEQSIRELVQEDFENLIVSHGENIHGGALERVKEAYSECLLGNRSAL